MSTQSDLERRQPVKTPHNEGRTVDTAWLLAAISAIDQEFEEGRLKFDENFLAFAGILDGLHQQAQDFIPSRAHLVDD
jgi:hypothetical protein